MLFKAKLYGMYFDSLKIKWLQVSPLPARTLSDSPTSIDTFRVVPTTHDAFLFVLSHRYVVLVSGLPL